MASIGPDAGGVKYQAALGKHLPPDRIAQLAWECGHRWRERTLGPAVTVHAYSSPLRRMGAYRIGAGGELERESQHFEHELRSEPALV